VTWLSKLLIVSVRGWLERRDGQKEEMAQAGYLENGPKMGYGLWATSHIWDSETGSRRLVDLARSIRHRGLDRSGGSKRDHERDRAEHEQFEASWI
jgi:hypothetical protein